MTDGLFDLATPEWETVKVTDLVTVAYRGRIVDLGAGLEVRFNGTHRGEDENGPYVVVHGDDSEGVRRNARFSYGAVVSVKAAQ